MLIEDAFAALLEYNADPADIHTDHCVCNQLIRTEPYYGMEMGLDQDEDAIVYFDANHPRCLNEWGVVLDPLSPMGIGHLHYDEVEESDEEITAGADGERQVNPDGTSSYVPAEFAGLLTINPDGSIHGHAFWDGVCRCGAAQPEQGIRGSYAMNLTEAEQAARRRALHEALHGCHNGTCAESE